MYSHTVTRLAYRPICFIMFVSGTCIGCLLGLLFIFMDRTAGGILLGTFISLLAGLCSAVISFIYTMLFNLLAPIIGGVSLNIVPSTNKEDEMIQSSDII